MLLCSLNRNFAKNMCTGNATDCVFRIADVVIPEEESSGEWIIGDLRIRSLHEHKTHSKKK